MTRSEYAAIGLMIAVGVVALTGCGGSTNYGPTPDTAEVARIRQGLVEGVDTAASSSQSVADPTGFGTLRGTFTFEGEPPAPSPLNITKDEAVCAPGGKTVYAQDLVIDPTTKGVADVLLYADGVPEAWCHPDAAPGKTDEIEFDQKECIFLTHVVAMQTSQSLRALNSDPIGHNLMVASFNQTIPANSYAIYQPVKEQRSPVKMSCSVHPWMEAWFINRDNSYFAVTKPDGSFEIPNLPAGVELEIRVWQQKYGPVSNVTVNGQPTTWSKGKMTVMLEPDTVTDLNVVLSASAL